MNGEAFHKHLDGCARCASQPFNLCDVGAQLLAAAGIENDQVAEFPRVVEPTRDPRRCPFCQRIVMVTRRQNSVLYAHDAQVCDAWERCCYAGGFSADEVETFHTFLNESEPR